MAKDNQLITEENDSIPVGMPQSTDEALADIEEGEREFERGETISLQGNTLRIAAFWDMRMNPSKLQKRI